MKPTPRRALTGALLAIAVTGALLTAPSTSYAAPAGAPAAVATKAAPARPAVGSCHAVSPREVARLTDPDAPVSCAKPHTSRTFAVPAVPAGVKMTDVDALGKVVTRQCLPAYERAVSRKIRQRLLSAYFYFWYAPTPEQIDQGARWVRCDLAIAGGTKSLVPLPRATTPALGTAPHPNVEARCYTKRGRSLSCSRAHFYRAKGVYTMSGRTYPSETARQRAAARTCPSVAGRRWVSFQPSPEQWRAGFKFFTCASITRR